MSELLPCPFCGEKRIFLNEPVGREKGSINCPACLATVPGEIRGEKGRQELIECWNTRPSLPVSEPGGWQEIETAPKGPLLLYWPEKVTGFHRQSSLPQRIAVGNAGDTPNRIPTHWMPLPAPPSPSPAPSQENDRG